MPRDSASRLSRDSSELRNNRLFQGTGRDFGCFSRNFRPKKEKWAVKAHFFIPDAPFFPILEGFPPFSRHFRIFAQRALERSGIPVFRFHGRRLFGVPKRNPMIPVRLRLRRPSVLRSAGFRPQAFQIPGRKGYGLRIRRKSPETRRHLPGRRSERRVRGVSSLSDIENPYPLIRPYRASRRAFRQACRTSGSASRENAVLPPEAGMMIQDGAVFERIMKIFPPFLGFRVFRTPGGVFRRRRFYRIHRYGMCENPRG